MTGQDDRRRRTAVSRRLAVVLGVGLLSLAWPLALLGGGPLAAPGQERAAASGIPRTYVVRQGDTLWSVAERLFPGRDPRPVVDALASELGGDALSVGERIAIPG